MVSQCIGSEHGDTIDTLKKRFLSQTSQKDFVDVKKFANELKCRKKR